MKKLFLVSFAIIAILSFSSCKKCTTCGFDYSLQGVNFTDMKEEVCGKKKELDNYKAECESAASLYGVKCTCTDK